MRHDIRVVGARQPKNRLALLPRAAGEDVLDRVVQHVAEVENPRDVRRRNDDRIRLRIRGFVTAEAIRVVPTLEPLRFYVLGLIGLAEFCHGGG